MRMGSVCVEQLHGWMMFNPSFFPSILRSSLLPSFLAALKMQGSCKLLGMFASDRVWHLTGGPVSARVWEERHGWQSDKQGMLSRTFPSA